MPERGELSHLAAMTTRHTCTYLSIVGVAKQTNRFKVKLKFNVEHLNKTLTKHNKRCLVWGGLLPASLRRPPVILFKNRFFNLCKPTNRMYVQGSSSWGGAANATGTRPRRTIHDRDWQAHWGAFWFCMISFFTRWRLFCFVCALVFYCRTSLYMWWSSAVSLYGMMGLTHSLTSSLSWRGTAVLYIPIKLETLNKPTGQNVNKLEQTKHVKVRSKL